MARKLEMLQSELEEQRRQELAQQTAPVSFTTGSRAGKPLESLKQRLTGNQKSFSLDDIRGAMIPYTVDQSDYDTYAQRVRDYTQTMAQKNETVTPETVKEYETYLKTEGLPLGATGTGLKMYAGGNGLPQGPINQAMAEKMNAELETGRLLTRVKQYKTAMDYRLGEKTNSYEDFKQRMAEAQGDEEAKKKAVAFGRENIDTEAKAEQKKKRSALQEQYDALEMEWMKAQNQAYTGTFATEQEYSAALQRADELQAQMDMLEKEIKATPETDQDYASKYVRENQQRAQDWNDALYGKYQGTDDQILAYGDERARLEEEIKQAYDAAYNGSFDTREDYDNALLRVYELQNQLDGMDAQAAQQRDEAQKEADSVQAIEREADHGEGSLGRLGQALIGDVVTGWNKAITGAVGFVAKPIEAIARTIVNAAEMGWAALNGDNESVKKEWEEIKQTPDYVMNKGIYASVEKYYAGEAQKAQEEAYHARKALSDSEALGVAYDVTQNILMMAPDVVMSMATGGGSTAATATQKAMTEYMASLGKNQLEKLAASMAGNPGFYSSLVREWASDIEEAKAKGVPMGVAEGLGTLTAILNAAIEVGGEDAGIQAIGQQGREAGAITELYEKLTGKTPGNALRIADTGVAEGLEEVTQGLTQGATTTLGRAIGGKDTKLISFMPGETAMINAPDLAKEGAVGALVGGVMEAGSLPLTVLRQQRAENEAIGEYMQQETKSQLKTIGENLSGKARDLARKYNPAKATPRQTGELMREIVQAMPEEMQGTIKETAAIDIIKADSSISKDAAMAIADMMAGHELSPQQIHELAQSKPAMDAVYKIMGLEEATPSTGAAPEAEESAAAPGRTAPNTPEEKRASSSGAAIVRAEEDIAPIPGTMAAQEAEAQEDGGAAAGERTETTDGKDETKTAQEAEKGQLPATESAPREKRLPERGDGFVRAETKNSLKTLAETLDESAKHAAEKFDADTATDRETIDLARAIVEVGPEEYKAAVRDALAVDLTKSDINISNEAADAIATRILGGEMSAQQKQAMAENKAGQEAMARIMQDEEAKAAPAPGAENVETVTQINTPTLEQGQVPATETAKQEKRLPVLFEAPAQTLGENVQTSTTAYTPQTVPARERESRQIVQIKEDEGSPVAVMADGSEEALEDAGLSEDEAALAREAAGLPKEAQAAMIGNYDKTENQSASEYAKGFQAIFNAVRNGMSGESVKSLFANALTAAQRRAAIGAGQMAYQQEKAAADAATRKAAQTLREKHGAQVGVLTDSTEKATAPGVYLAKVTGEIGNRAAAMIRLIGEMAEKYGFQARIYDSLGVENGNYRTGTNIINLALDAEEGMLTRTASHELYHFITEWNKEAGEKLKAFALNALQNTAGYDLEARIGEIQERYSDEKGQALTREQAEEEIAAEAMLDQLGTEENLKGLFKDADKSVLQKIGDWLKSTVDWLKNAMNRLAGNHAEVRALQDQAQVMEQISRQFQAALTQAGENYRATQQGLYNEARQDADVQEYIQAMSQDITPEDAQAEREALAGRLFMRAEKGWIGQHAEEYEEALQRFVTAIKEFGTGKKALNKALSDQGLDAAPRDMNSALAYAGRQLANEGTRSQMKEKVDTDAQRIEENKKAVANMETVKQLNGDEFTVGTKELALKVYDMFKQDSSVYNDELGDIDITYRGIKDSIAHGIGPEKAAAFAGLKEVLQKGKILHAEHNWKNRGYDTYIIGAPIRIGTEDYYMGVLVKRDNQTQRFYVHEVVTQNAVQKNSGIESRSTGTLLSSRYPSGVNPTINSILNSLQNYKSQSKKTPETKSSIRSDTAAQQEAAALESVKGDAELYAQMRQDENARAALQLLYQLHRQTTQGGENALIQKGAFEKRLSQIADSLLEETGSKYPKRTLMAELRKVYTAMEQQGYNAGEILQYTRDMMQKVLEAAPGVLVEQDESTQEALRILKNRPFYLSAEQKSEIAGTYGAVVDYTRKNYGRLRIRRQDAKTASLADVWREDLAPLLPGTFAEDTNELDMPGILDAWLENANEKKFAGEYGANIGAYATDKALNAMLAFYDVPGALRTKGEIREEYREQFEKARHRINQLKVTARGAMDQARLQYEEKYRQRVEKALERKQETDRKRELRAKITRDVKALNTLNTRASDSRHAPEEMRAAALAAVRPFVDGSGVFEAGRIGELANQYAMLQARAGEVRGFDEDILEAIRELPNKLNGRRLSELTEADLQDIADIMGNIHKMINEANEAFVAGRKTTIDQLSGRLKADMQAKGPAKQGKAAEAIRGLSLKETTPTYFADRVGGVIKELFGDLFRGQNKWAFAMDGAQKYVNTLINDYHVNDWLYDDKHARFTTQHGDLIELNRAEAMSLYALWKRETTNRLQNANHLRIGGFMYEHGTDYEGVDTLRPHPLTENDMRVIRSYLTDEQMELADKMVGYLSTDMAKLGNETSMRLYGYEKFKEGYYFPYESDRRFLTGDLTQTGEQVKQPQNAGISKATMQNAATPIKMGDFFQVWGNHVNQMALYHAFAENLDTMSRVFNQRIPGEIRLDSATGNEIILSPESNWAEMERALGAEGVQYIKTLARDVAGGVRADERGFMAKGLSSFKKASVAGNISVVLQQPTAYARAMALVNPRYLLMSNPAKIGKNIGNMYKYSGVAQIKKMGKFDTGTGKGAVNWLLEDIKPETLREKTLDKIDEVTGFGAEKADEWTWGLLWGAIEKETENTRTDLARGSEEFYRAVAERFENVVNHTQVYDSVLSRSEWMRSNTTMDKMATAFMAEPTLTLNMLQDAMLTAKQPGGAQKVARAAGAFLLNAVLTAAAKSLATALRRKDDEGRTMLEKYLAEFAGNLSDDISPWGLAGMIPWVRDVVSIFQGYDVERSDMNAVQMLYNAYKTVTNDNKTVEDKLQAATGAVGNLFGVPAKNVWRDAEGIIRNVFLGGSASGPSSARDIKYSMLDNLSTIGQFQLWDSSAGAYYERIAEAMGEGDEQKADDLWQYMTDTNRKKESTVNSGVKSALKEQTLAGRVSEERAAELLEDQLGVNAGQGYWTVADWMGGDDYKKYNAFFAAVDTGDKLRDVIKTYTDHGVSAETLAGQITSQYKQRYIDLSKSDPTKATELKMRLATAYAALGYDREKKLKDIDKWLK